MIEIVIKAYGALAFCLNKVDGSSITIQCRHKTRVLDILSDLHIPIAEVGFLSFNNTFITVYEELKESGQLNLISIIGGG